MVVVLVVAPGGVQGNAGGVLPRITNPGLLQCGMGLKAQRAVGGQQFEQERQPFAPAA